MPEKSKGLRSTQHRGSRKTEKHTSTKNYMLSFYFCSRGQKKNYETIFYSKGSLGHLSDLAVVSEFPQLKNMVHKSNIMLLDSISSDTIIAESKSISNQHTSKYKRECCLIFFWCNLSSDFLYQICQS